MTMAETSCCQMREFPSNSNWLGLKKIKLEKCFLSRWIDLHNSKNCIVQRHQLESRLQFAGYDCKSEHQLMAREWIPRICFRGLWSWRSFEVAFIWNTACAYTVITGIDISRHKYPIYFLAGCIWCLSSGRQDTKRQSKTAVHSVTKANCGFQTKWRRHREGNWTVKCIL